MFSVPSRFFSCVCFASASAMSCIYWHCCFGTSRACLLIRSFVYSPPLFSLSSPLQLITPSPPLPCRLFLSSLSSLFFLFCLPSRSHAVSCLLSCMPTVFFFLFSFFPALFRFASFFFVFFLLCFMLSVLVVVLISQRHSAGERPDQQGSSVQVRGLRVHGEADRDRMVSLCLSA